MSNVWTFNPHNGEKPDPTPKDQQQPLRRMYCPHCDRELPCNVNLIPVQIDGNIAMRIAGYSVPSPCPWCGEPAIKEVAVDQQAPPTPGTGLWTPGKPGAPTLPMPVPVRQ